MAKQLDMALIKQYLAQAVARAAQRRTDGAAGELSVPCQIRRDAEKVLHWEHFLEMHCPDPNCKCGAAEIRSPCHPKAGLALRVSRETGILTVSCARCRRQLAEIAVASSATDESMARVLESVGRELPGAADDVDHSN